MSTKKEVFNKGAVAAVTGMPRSVRFKNATNAAKVVPLMERLREAGLKDMAD